MKTFMKMVDNFSDIADFCIIYIEEAHPKEGNVVIGTHQCLEERFAAAEKLQDMCTPNCPILVDSMSNEALYHYQATPDRLYIINDGELGYVGGIGPLWYNLDEVREWLNVFRDQEDKKLN